MHMDINITPRWLLLLHGPVPMPMDHVEHRTPCARPCGTSKITCSHTSFHFHFQIQNFQLSALAQHIKITHRIAHSTQHTAATMKREREKRKRKLVLDYLAYALYHYIKQKELHDNIHDYT